MDDIFKVLLTEPTEEDINEVEKCHAKLMDSIERVEKFMGSPRYSEEFRERFKAVICSGLPDILGVDAILYIMSKNNEKQGSINALMAYCEFLICYGYLTGKQDEKLESMIK